MNLTQPEPNRFAEGGDAFYKWYNDPVYRDPINPYTAGSVENEEWDTGWEDALYNRLS